jgi:hypothetical protein
MIETAEGCSIVCKAQIKILPLQREDYVINQNQKNRIKILFSFCACNWDRCSGLLVVDTVYACHHTVRYLINWNKRQSVL